MVRGTFSSVLTSYSPGLNTGIGNMTGLSGEGFVSEIHRFMNYSLETVKW